MKPKKLSKSKRIALRRQKAEIRKQAATQEEANVKIRELLNKAYR